MSSTSCNSGQSLVVFHSRPELDSTTQTMDISSKDVLSKKSRTSRPSEAQHHSAEKHMLKSPPEVKTGCKTCKTRHIKCDETRPECLRCSNFGRKCEGYLPEEDDRSKQRTPPPNKRKILSKDAQESIRPSSHILPIRPSPVTVPWRDDQEHAYFCIFRDTTAIDLSGGFEPSLWNRLVLQACDHAAIRELVTGVAAFSKAHKNYLMEASIPSWDRESLQKLRTETITHKQYGLMQYGNALKRIQEMVSSGQSSVRIALITALLIFVFESFHRDTVRAVAPIKSALELIFKQLSSISRSNRSARSRTHTQSSGSICEELLLPFIRQDGLCLTIFSKAQDDPHRSLDHIFNCFYTTDGITLPSCFTTISEAKGYLDDMEWRIAPHGRVLKRTIGAKTQQLNNPPSDFKLLPGTFRHWCTGPIESSPIALRAQCDQWYCSFAHILEHSRATAGRATFVPTTILHIRALFHDWIIRGYESQENQFGDWGRCVEITSTIISLSRDLVRHPEFSRGFVFDRGIIPALAMILMRSSDQTLKWKAYEVVKSMIPRRESVWDSRIVAEAAYRTIFANEERVQGCTVNPPVISYEYSGPTETTLWDQEILWLFNSSYESTPEPGTLDGLVDDPGLLDMRSMIPPESSNATPQIVERSSVEEELMCQYLGLGLSSER